MVVTPATLITNFADKLPFAEVGEWVAVGPLHWWARLNEFAECTRSIAFAKNGVTPPLNDITVNTHDSLFRRLPAPVGGKDANLSSRAVYDNSFVWSVGLR